MRRQYSLSCNNPKKSYELAVPFLRLMPQLGDEIPGWPGMFCRTRTLSNFHDSSKSMRGWAIFQSYKTLSVKLNGVMMQGETYTDCEGYPLLVNFASDNGTDEATLWQSLGTCPRLYPGSLLEYDFWVGSPDWSEFRDYEGCVNSGEWNEGQPGQWLCLPISTSRTCVDNRRQRWWPIRMSFQFQGYNMPAGGYADWRPILEFEYPYQNVVPPEIGPNIAKLVRSTAAGSTLSVHAGTVVEGGINLADFNHSNGGAIRPALYKAKDFKLIPWAASDAQGGLLPELGQLVI
jgi:hypothetical protein